VWARLGRARRLREVFRATLRLLSGGSVAEQLTEGMLRLRRTLVNNRTACLNAARGLLRSFGYRVPVSSRSGCRTLTTGKVPEDLYGLVPQLATTALDLDEKVRALDDEVLAAGRRVSRGEALSVGSGIGR